MPLSIAVLGLGAMGLPMAAHLSSSFDVTGFDPFEARRDLASAEGVRVVAEAAQAARDADVVLIAVRNRAQLDEVLYGEGGVVPAMRPGSIVVLTSTVGVSAVEEVAARLASDSIGLVDAPVSGGPVRAGEGDLLVTCGAYPDVWERTLPVLEEMAGTLVLVGDEPGKGQALKTVNQLLCGIHIAAAGEALALAGRLGLDQRAALDALMSGAAESFMLGNRGPRAIEAYEGGEPEVASRLDIFVKDMGIVTAAAKSVGLSVPLAAAAEQLYVLGAAQGRAADDDSTVIRVLSPDRR
ncbi:NAD(P)-dependent oxidoreductase [Actinomyces sp. B33]|uniref:NAD(P)-dependent oxidoreductase n=1 Tax=Actinomyces sp. B33 TaxID=2942131 RepID=UPI00234217D2|nr:NAD(P)-dependent oxidoreductase [Actinomyces sp. B33]MDC4233789.1 NAD(P)-dependent oxidoreductase [Actinomyces sp. B33]